ncbi:MAG: bacillithiol biosynthesis deacetylase BshB1 [Coriobacteriia bacterium]|nr:bacillithiol biosynthesis deacetylase BshB1 [Coriobacteriia bacterium]
MRRVMLDLPNRELADTVDARWAVAAALRELRPRIVVGPYPVDAHPDHVAASALVAGGRFYAKLSKSRIAGEPHLVRRVYQYAAIHASVALRPSFVVPVGLESLQRKLDALAAYRSQFVENPANAHVIGRMETSARYWGGLVGAEAGEPFFATEVLGVSSFASLV